MRKFTWLLSGLLIGSSLFWGAGCGPKGPRAGAFDDDLDPSFLSAGEDGTYALGARMDAGNLVTDVQFESVLFAYDSFQLADSELQKIEQTADYMRSHGTVTLIAEGHCDERGSREYNLSLGEYRALAVRAHLIGLGIEGSRIQTRSFGEEQPADAGHDDSAWRINRRVEFMLYR